MTHPNLDFDAAFTLDEGLPRPVWGRLEESVAGLDKAARGPAEVVFYREWLARLAAAHADRYRVGESDHFLLLAAVADGHTDRLLAFAQRCRTSLASVLEGVADLNNNYKDVVLAFRRPEEYYRYIAPFYPEGVHGGSGGIQIRQGPPHVALWGTDAWLIEQTIAHELTHLALCHLTLPQWVEEGLAQVFEHEMTGRNLLEVDEEMAGRQKRYWGKHGLAAFWSGECFSRPGPIQGLGYQLAEVLMRLLLEEARPGWFRRRTSRERFFAFLREASAADGGEAAARAHLGTGVSTIAERFLGPPAPDG